MIVLLRVGTLVAATAVSSLVGCGGSPPGAAGSGRNVGGEAVHPTLDESERRSHLHALGDRYLTYHAAHGRSPTTKQELVEHALKGETGEILNGALAKLQSGNIEMIWNVRQFLDGSRYVWGYEKQTELTSGYVLMSDNSVTLATRKEFAKMKRLPSAP